MITKFDSKAIVSQLKSFVTLFIELDKRAISSELIFGWALTTSGNPAFLISACLKKFQIYILVANLNKISWIYRYMFSSRVYEYVCVFVFVYM